jgi:hypothetical protein
MLTPLDIAYVLKDADPMNIIKVAATNNFFIVLIFMVSTYFNITYDKDAIFDSIPFTLSPILTLI